MIKTFFQYISALAVTLLFCTCSEEPKKLVALSFDDGPSDVTPLILETLQKEKIPASFFVIGSTARSETNLNLAGDAPSYDNTEFMKQAYEKGCEIGNHTWTHPYMSKLSEDEMMEEVERTSDFIESVIGKRPTLFRPPYIDVNELMHQKIGMTFIAGIDCQDWEPTVTAEQRTQMILDKVKDGDIILMHDFAGNTPTSEAIKTLIPELKKQGYKFVTISELFKRKGVKPETNSGIVYSNVLQQ